MRDEVLSAATSKGIFFSPDAMEMILSNEIGRASCRERVYSGV